MLVEDGRLSSFSGTLCSVRSQEASEARLARGREFAPSLVGLDVNAAVQQVAAEGYRAQLIPWYAEAVTADLDSLRIRLFLDEDDLVSRATAG